MKTKKKGNFRIWEIVRCLSLRYRGQKEAKLIGDLYYDMIWVAINQHLEGLVKSEQRMEGRMFTIFLTQFHDINESFFFFVAFRHARFFLMRI